MRVLMVGRPVLFNAYGGDRIQIENTASELRKLGVSVDIDTGKIKDYSIYDIVHVFQLDWHPECYWIIDRAKKQGKPVVFSPIHHNIDEVKRFDDEFAFDFRRVSRFLFKDQLHRDTFKDVYRAIFSPSRIPITIAEMLIGLRRMYKYAISSSNTILVQTNIEALDLEKTFDEKFNWHKVSNGVGKVFLEKPSTDMSLGIHDYILCVGRIEPRKNQLNVIKAVKMLRDETGVDMKLVFVGAKAKLKHYEYYHLFNKELESCHWIKHINFIQYEHMPSIYSDAKVCVSASWFETTGLTSLESLICGSNAVASGERAKEYLGNYVSYCDPGDINSMKNAIKHEYYAERPELPYELKQQYTWENTAIQTLVVYNKVLNNN